MTLQKSKSKIIKLSDLIIEKYWKVFSNQYMHKIITSGRAGTKSSCAAICSVYNIVSKDNCSVVVLRKRHNKLRKTVFKEIIRAIGRLGLNKKDFKITTSPMEIRYLKNNNTIYFAGSDSIDDTKGIIDPDKPIEIVVLDELTEFFDIGDGVDELTNIEATFVRGNNAEFSMLYLYNPPKNPNAQILEWTRQMEKREDCIHIHSTYKDVPAAWLGSKLIESAKALEKLDYKLYEWIWLGNSIGVDELIYYMFSDEKHINDDFNREYIGEIVVGIDYGQKNATTFQAFGIDVENDCVQGLKEYYHSGRDSNQKSPSEYAKDFKKFCEEINSICGHPVNTIVIDPSAQGLSEEIKRIMPGIRIKDAENSVALGISRVQKLLTYNILKIHRDQKMLKKEFGLYQYDEKSIDKGIEKPIKDNDHCLDATRYAIMYLWKKVKRYLPIAEQNEKE